MSATVARNGHGICHVHAEHAEPDRGTHFHRFVRDRMAPGRADINRAAPKLVISHTNSLAR